MLKSARQGKLPARQAAPPQGAPRRRADVINDYLRWQAVGGPTQPGICQHGQHACKGHALLLQLRSRLWSRQVARAERLRPTAPSLPPRSLNWLQMCAELGVGRDQLPLLADVEQGRGAAAVCACLWDAAEQCCAQGLAVGGGAPCGLPPAHAPPPAGAVMPCQRISITPWTNAHCQRFLLPNPARFFLTSVTCGGLLAGPLRRCRGSTAPTRAAACGAA